MSVHRQISEIGRASSVASVVLNLVGPLRVSTRDERDLTPSSAKAQGLLALLAVAPGLRRPRTWLQDKLWSESPQEQGASNLRQTILRLRHALGPEASCLIAGRGWVGLDPRRVRVVVGPCGHDLRSSEEMPEFCEGLDIADPEFEDWIRDQRLSFLDRAEEVYEQAATVQRNNPPTSRFPAPNNAPRPILLLAPCEAGSEPLRALANILTADIAAQVASLGSAEVIGEQPAGFALPPSRAVRLRIRAAEGPDGAMFRAHLEDPLRGVLIRSIGRNLRLTRTSCAHSDAYQRFVSEVASIVAFELGRCRGVSGDAEEASALGYRALAHATDFTLASLREGDRLLAEACAIFPAPAYLAWRAHFRVAAIFERHVDNAADALDEALELVERARDADPYNALVLAVSSDVYALLKGRSEDALSLSLRAVETDPANVFARISLAYRLAGTEHAARAHVEALRALRLASGTPNPALWVMICCMTATRCGRYSDATRFGTEAHRIAPQFSAPLRYLAALHYHAGNDEAALAALNRLKALEPDFSIELMRSEDYPIWTLRNTPLLRIADSKLL